VKCWQRYIEHKVNCAPQVINTIYERALKELPGRFVLRKDTLFIRIYIMFRKSYLNFNGLVFVYYSYKLWYNYLRLRRKQIYGKCVVDPAYEDVNNAFERSLVFMHKVSVCSEIYLLA
jgi:pre-mRNA-splicing factor SYF1